MYPHHAAAIRNTTAYFEQMPEVQALLLGGSIAHGLAGPASDVDVLIVVSEQAYAERARTGQLHFFNRDLCTYADGDVDGKYFPLSFLQQVAERGSEPARFAFADAQVLFSHLPGLAAMLAEAGRFPLSGLDERLRRFYAQFEAWHWFAGEAFKHTNAYLLGVAVSKLILFGGRLVLAHNHLLYPYHKWFLRQLGRTAERPAALLPALVQLQQTPTPETVTSFYDLVKNFYPWPAPADGWPAQFMRDSEWNWLPGPAPIDDL